MKVNKAELQKALEKVKPGLSSKELIQQSTSFAFLGGRVVTYNDEISVSHPIKDLNIEGAVKAEVLYEYLNKIKQDEIDIECEDTQVRIVAGRSTAGLVFEHEVSLPIDEIDEVTEWKKIPQQLVKALSYCYPYCLQDMSRPILSCVHVVGNVVEATDNFQVIRWYLDDSTSLDEFLLPARAAKELVKYDVKEISIGDSWIHFRTEDDTVFSSRTLEGKYPDISRVLEVEGQPLSLSSAFLQALERARVLARNNLGIAPSDLHMAEVEIEEGKIEVRAEGDHGWFKENIRTKYKGRSVHFIVAVELLLNLISSDSSCVVSKDRIKFTGEQWEHVIALASE